MSELTQNATQRRQRGVREWLPLSLTFLLLGISLAWGHPRPVRHGRPRRMAQARLHRRRLRRWHATRRRPARRRIIYRHPVYRHPIVRRRRAGLRNRPTKRRYVVRRSVREARARRWRRWRERRERRLRAAAIPPRRAAQIQQALVRVGYLDQSSGVWDHSTRQALKKYQADHHWQTKLVPDARALIALGLGPRADESTASLGSSTPAGDAEK